MCCKHSQRNKARIDVRNVSIGGGSKPALTATFSFPHKRRLIQYIARFSFPVCSMLAAAPQVFVLASGVISPSSSSAPRYLFSQQQLVAKNVTMNLFPGKEDEGRKKAQEKAPMMVKGFERGVM